MGRDDISTGTAVTGDHATSAHPDPSDADGRRPSRIAISLLVSMALVAVSVVAGVVAGAFLTRSSGATTQADARVQEVRTASRPGPVADAPPAPEKPAVPGPGPDAEAAAAGFLTAEATRDLETAFTYLHPDEQAAFGSPAGYVSAHADLVGPVTGFTVDRADPHPGDPARATVLATVGFEPSLDLVVGLIPATATATIPVLEGPDGWTVSLADTVFEPILPDDDRAAADARDYIRGAVACDPPPTGYSGALIGRPQLIAETCGATGDATVADLAPLDDPVRVQPFLSAFGPDVTSWARVAHVTAPVPLRLVLAPYGDAWTVIGVLPET